MSKPYTILHLVFARGYKARLFLKSEYTEASRRNHRIRILQLVYSGFLKRRSAF
jgi:hypothetical protein